MVKKAGVQTEARRLFCTKARDTYLSAMDNRWGYVSPGCLFDLYTTEFYKMFIVGLLINCSMYDITNTLIEFADFTSGAAKTRHGKVIPRFLLMHDPRNSRKETYGS